MGVKRLASVWRWVTAVSGIVVLAFVLTACGNDGDENGEQIQWAPYQPAVQTGLAQEAERASPAAEDHVPDQGAPAVPGTPEATPGTPAATPATVAQLSDEELRDLQPNELGVIPVLQYHLITTDREMVNEATRHIDDFRADLQALYDNDFYVISLREFVRGEIAAPAGKHPVVLTFDDSSPGQFRFIEEDGGLIPDPDSAIGVMEEFFAEHPDFGRGGFFAVLPYNCFAEPTEPDQMQYCDQKIDWLADNGYEIGNHTLGHADLLDVSDAIFMEEVGEAVRWIDERVDGDANMARVLIVPYGNYPDRERNPQQREMMQHGFEYEGELIQLEAAFMVGAHPSPPTISSEWYPLFVPRIQMFDEEIERWVAAYERGEVILFTSDGDPETITVPNPLPAGLDETLNMDAIEASGHDFIEYDPNAGT